MGRIVCLDTNVVIWGILNEGRKNADVMRERARHLLASLEENKDHIVIPALVIAEVTMKMRADREKFIKAINSKVEILPLCGQSVMRLREVRDIGMEMESSYFTGKEITVDSLIIACCLKHKVDVLYTEDDKMKALASKFLQVSGLPTVRSRQLTFQDCMGTLVRPAELTRVG